MTKRITIKYDTGWEQYAAPGPDGTEAQCYYTDDREDAIDTCRAIYGVDVQITHQRDS